MPSTRRLANDAGTKQPGKPKANPQPSVGNKRREAGPSKEIGGTGKGGKKPRGNSDAAPRSHNAHPRAHPTFDKEADLANMEEHLAQLKVFAHKIRAQAYASWPWMRDLQLTAEGDVPREENIIQQIVQQGRDLCESALSWEA